MVRVSHNHVLSFQLSCQLPCSAGVVFVELKEGRSHHLAGADIRE